MFFHFTVSLLDVVCLAVAVVSVAATLLRRKFG